jgi:hypothetical protein
VGKMRKNWKFSEVHGGKKFNMIEASKTDDLTMI